MFRWRGGRKAKVILEVFCCRLFHVQPPTGACTAYTTFNAIAINCLVRGAFNSDAPKSGIFRPTKQLKKEQAAVAYCFPKTKTQPARSH